MTWKKYYFLEVILLRKFIHKMQIAIFFVLSSVFAQFKYEFCDNPGKTGLRSMGSYSEFWKNSVLARRYGKNCEALRAAKPDQIESEKKFYDSITRKGAICLVYFFSSTGLRTRTG